MRLFATIAVVIMHVCTTIVDNVDLFGPSNTQATVLLCVSIACRWAVPAFFMITGYLLLDSSKEIDYPLVFKKYCLRILLVLIIFGIPFAAMKNITDFNGIFDLCKKTFLAVLSNNGFGHFWYLYVLIGLYLIMPVIKIFIAHARNKKTVEILALILFVFCSVIPLIRDVFGVSIAFSIPLTYPVFYLLMGYLIKKHLNRIPAVAAIIGFVTGAVLLIVLTVLIRKPGLYEYHSPFVVAMGLGVFVFFLRLKLKGNDFVWKLDRLSFGVYIIHPVFIHVVYRLVKITPLKFGEIGYVAMIPVFAAAFLVISFVCVWVMMLIKPLKKYVL